MSIHTSEADGFTRVDCVVADIIRNSPELRVASSLTDLGGRYGEPVVFTEWGLEAGGRWIVAMREIRRPDDPTRICQHWVPAPGFDHRAWEQGDR